MSFREGIINVQSSRALGLQSLGPGSWVRFSLGLPWLPCVHFVKQVGSEYKYKAIFWTKTWGSRLFFLRVFFFFFYGGGVAHTFSQYFILSLLPPSMWTSDLLFPNSVLKALFQPFSKVSQLIKRLEPDYSTSLVGHMFQKLLYFNTDLTLCKTRHQGLEIRVNGLLLKQPQTTNSAI